MLPFGSLSWWFLTIQAPVWCFLFVTLFNLQGTRRSRRNIAIILNFISFVKNFFKVFWLPICFRISSNFLSLPSFVKNFFQKFLAFRFHIRCGNFFMLPHLVDTVKYFFHFLSAAVLTAATAWLEYHAYPFLSTPFFLFFRFFLLFSSALHFCLFICYDKSDF